MNTDAPWVDGLTFGQVLDQTAARLDDREAVVFPRLGWRRTWSQFRREARLVARALLALEVGKGEHIGIWSTNWPQWLLTQFAAAYVGAPLVNVNPAYRAHELEYVLRQADITTLILTDAFKSSDYFEILGQVCPDLGRSRPGELHLASCPRLRRVISIQNQERPGVFSWQRFLEKGERIPDSELDRRAVGIDCSEVVNLQYTSGTTGFPKGVQLTHRNLLMNAYHVGDRQRAGERDRFCVPVPFYHCFGCVMGSLMCAVHGSTLVVPAESFDPEATLQAIQDERCTAVYGVPTMFIAELNHPHFDSFDLSSLRTGIMAGSPCPIEIMRRVVDRMGARQITIAYGLTEASPVITQTQVDDGLQERVGTVGTALPGLEVKIVEPGTTDPVAEGQQGEIMVRGHGVMKGYYNKPEETARALESDGWLHSGDLAVRTPAGYYRITGRIKDMLIRGGENVYPREIEEFLHAHPAIADVQVVGLPDERMGEEISAWILLKPGKRLSEQEVHDFCDRRIAHFKVPRYIFFVTEYPTTVTGKIQKFKLRELGIQKLGLEKSVGVETA